MWDEQTAKRGLPDQQSGPNKIARLNLSQSSPMKLVVEKQNRHIWFMFGVTSLISREVVDWRNHAILLVGAEVLQMRVMALAKILPSPAELLAFSTSKTQVQRGHLMKFMLRLKTWPSSMHYKGRLPIMSVQDWHAKCMAKNDEKEDVPKSDSKTHSKSDSNSKSDSKSDSNSKTHSKTTIEELRRTLIDALPKEIEGKEPEEHKFIKTQIEALTEYVLKGSFEANRLNLADYFRRVDLVVSMSTNGDSEYGLVRVLLFNPMQIIENTLLEAQEVRFGRVEDPLYTMNSRNIFAVEFDKYPLLKNFEKEQMTVAFCEDNIIGLFFNLYLHKLRKSQKVCVPREESLCVVACL